MGKVYNVRDTCYRMGELIMSDKRKDICDNAEDPKICKNEKKANTDSDVYAETKCRLEDSNVAIPTVNSVEDAKEWVDDENKR